MRKIPVSMVLALFFLSASYAEKPLMKDFMGINFHTFQSDPELYRVLAGNARDYHNWDWDNLGKMRGKPKFPWTRNRVKNGQPVSWNEIYGSWKKAELTVDVSLQFGNIKTKGDWANMDETGFTKKMSKYAFTYGYEFARWFGPSGKCKLVDSIEIGNEPHDWTDDQYQAVFEALARGVRKGDPKMKILPCAVAVRPENSYIRSLAPIHGGDLDQLFDVFNMHIYAFLSGWPRWERANPEEPRLSYLRKIDEMIEYKSRYESLKDKPIWITEFGYDSLDEEDYAKHKAMPSSDWIPATDLQQAQWLVRSFLLFSEKDVERAYLYFYDDRNEHSLHAASGVTRNGKPKPSFYALQYLYSRLGDYRFNRVVERKTDELYIFEYAKDQEPQALCWVVWSPTREKSDKVRILTGLPSLPKSVQVMPVTPDVLQELEWKKVAANSISLSVGESPRFLYFGGE
jgi:serine/threonine-protein kinase ATR